VRICGPLADGSFQTPHGSTSQRTPPVYVGSLISFAASAAAADVDLFIIHEIDTRACYDVITTTWFAMTSHVVSRSVCRGCIVPVMRMMMMMMIGLCTGQLSELAANSHRTVLYHGKY